MLLTLLAVHATAFAAVLVLSRRDVLLVDDFGPWVDAGVVPAVPAERAAV